MYFITYVIVINTIIWLQLLYMLLKRNSSKTHKAIDIDKVV